jgi:hypothetical protein
MIQNYTLARLLIMGKVRRIRYQAVVIAACLAVTGCGGTMTGKAPSPQLDEEQSPVPAPEWTAGIIDRPRSDRPAASLVAVRTGSHEGFDQVVFEFDERVPGYHTEYIDQPVRKCGSGKTTHLAGDGWLEVRMSPVNAHTEEGHPTVADRERMPNLPVLSELELTCDFEAVVTWVFGVESPNRYQVLELTSPPRLVVKIRH